MAFGTRNFSYSCDRIFLTEGKVDFLFLLFRLAFWGTLPRKGTGNSTWEKILNTVYSIIVISEVLVFENRLNHVIYLYQRPDAGAKPHKANDGEAMDIDDQGNETGGPQTVADVILSEQFILSLSKQIEDGMAVELRRWKETYDNNTGTLMKWSLVQSPGDQQNEVQCIFDFIL